MSDKKKVTINIKTLLAAGGGVITKFRRYSFVAFVIFVAVLYGFVILRINNLGNTQPSSVAVSGQVQAAQAPHIDKSVIQQLNSLQDNSVSVQALFNQARSNPFQ
jgi:hypothetical protein